MNVQRQIDQLLTQQAAEWMELLSCGKADNAQFTRWVGESPRHLREFMAILALNEELPQAFARAGIDRHALLARISPGITRLTDTVGSTTRPRMFTRMRMAAAAALLAAVGLGAWMLFATRGEQFGTDVGEQRMVTLPDGSLVYLNADSSVQVRLQRNARNIELLRGEALFQVAPDPQRPFSVTTGEATVRVIGTLFNVKRSPVRTLVSVLEGKVQVSGEWLGGGDEMEISPAGARKWQGNAEDRAAWRQRQLVFSRTSLEEAVADFNRFHRSGRLILENVKPGLHHFTGTFAADDVESFAAVLAQEEDLRVERQRGDYVIRMR